MTEAALLEPPAAGAPARPALPDLILLRLLPAKTSVAPKKLREDLAVCFRHGPTAAEVAEAVAALKAEGFVTLRGQRVTTAGGARALQYLGLDKLPPRTSWPTIVSKYLVPRALGLPLDSAEYTKANSGEKLAAFLLKRELDLPNAGHTLTAVVDALLCRELGYPAFTKLNDLIRAKLGGALGGDPMSKSDAKKFLPRVKLNVPSLKAAKLHAAVLAGQRDEPPAVSPAREPDPVVIEEPFDLEAFANTVKAAARTCPTGRFGDNKVFISHVWNQLCDEPHFAALGLDGFMAKLVEANRADLLTLSRADLVQLMDPADVRASEITYLTATFHFILVERN